jgi:hypothetical protein
MLFAGKWMELENIRLSEVSQAQIVKCLKFFLICRNQTYMLKVYINMYDHMYAYIYIYSDRTISN